MENTKKKDIIIICLGVLLVVAVAAIIVLFNIKKDIINSMNGTVIAVGSDYILVKTDKEDYIIKNIDNIGSYASGDEIKVDYYESKIDTESDPKTIVASSDKLVTKAKQPEESITEPAPKPIIETKPSGGNSNKVESNTGSNADADTEVLTYVDNLEKSFDSGSITDSLKSGFVTVVDFIFYDGKIANHTFSELTDSAKLKVLSAVLYFDGKIDTYFPGYKESISSGAKNIYSTLKTNVVESYLNVTVRICENNASECETAKNGFGELKKNFGLTWSLIKDIAGDGVSKLKSWYEVWSGK